MALTSGATKAPDEVRKRRRAVLAGGAGTLVEHYDDGIYGLVVVAIASNLFPHSTAATLGAMATYVITFVARPFGAVVLGRLADRKGRREALIVSLVLMTAGSVLIGLIPKQSTVGILATILLIALRLLQGFSKGGELASAAVFVSEYTSRRRRGFTSSFVTFAAQSGSVVASLVVLGLQAALSEAAFDSWGWRVAFLIAVLPAVVIIYFRLKLEDTPVFRALKEKARPARKSVLTRSGVIRLLQVAGMSAMGSPTYLILAYFPIYFTKAGLSPTTTTLVIVVINMGIAAAIPLAGALGDRIGRKRQLILSASSMIVLVVPAFALAGTGSIATGIIGGCLLGAPLALYMGAFPAVLSEMFDSEVRGTGANVGLQIGSSVFAALPFVVLALGSVLADPLVPAYCVLVVAVIGLVTVLKMPGARLTGRHQLHDLADAGAGTQ